MTNTKTETETDVEADRLDLHEQAVLLVPLHGVIETLKAAETTLLTMTDSPLLCIDSMDRREAREASNLVRTLQLQSDILASLARTLLPVMGSE